MSDKKKNPDRPRLSFGPRPFREIFDVGSKWLADRLQQAMQSGDRELIELASSASTNEMQNLYFEAVLIVRRDRAQAEERWLKAWTALFEVKPSSEPSQFASLLSDEVDASAYPDRAAYEEAVFTHSLVRQAYSTNEDAIQALTARLNAALESENFDDASNPLSPQCVIGVCQEAFETLNVDPAIRRVLYKEIDRLILQMIGKLYNHCNLLLKKRGMLPDLVISTAAKPAAKTQTDKEKSGQDPVSTQLSEECISGGETFKMLRRLLRKEELDNAETDGDLSTNRLTELLREHQSELVAAASIPGPGNALELPELVQRVMSSTADSSTQRISALDQDTIELVSLVFHAILDDPQLAVPIVMMLRKLQVPMLQLALVERGMFSNSSHPARGLLNEFSAACIGWLPDGDPDRDPLYRQITKIIDTLLQAKQQHATLYAEVLEEFREYNTRVRRKAALLQERLAGAEHARAMAEEARNVVNRLAQRRLDRFEVPQAARELILGSVKRWLQWVYLREGAGSDDWKQSVDKLDRFISCFADNGNENAEQRRERFATAVKELGAALDVMGDDLMQVRAQLGKVERSHEGLLGEPLPESDDTSDVDDPSEEPVASASGSDDEDDDFGLMVDAEMLEHVDQLRVESWFQLNPDDGHPTRCKLALVLPSTGRHIFMNRLGQKIAEFGRNRLAWALSNGTLVPIEERQVFDSALESVIGRLQQQVE